MDLERAVEVFVRAFCAGKSHAHPYLAEKLDELWVMRDAPGRKFPRKIEVVACELPAEDVVETIRNSALGWHFLCHVHANQEDFDAVRKAYKSLGYRSLSTEWMFTHDLKHVPVISSDPAPRVVRNQEESNAIPQMGKQKWPVKGPGTQFAIYDDTRDYGWVKDIPFERAGWVQGLHVRPDVRGRGYGRALMSAVLQLDQRERREASVLLASTAGSRLYPHLGYRQIGILQAFCPIRRD